MPHNQTPCRGARATSRLSAEYVRGALQVGWAILGTQWQRPHHDWEGVSRGLVSAGLLPPAAACNAPSHLVGGPPCGTRRAPHKPLRAAIAAPSPSFGAHHFATPTWSARAAASAAGIASGGGGRGDRIGQRDARTIGIRCCVDLDRTPRCGAQLALHGPGYRGNHGHHGGLQGCSGTFARSLGSAMATGAAASFGGRRGRTPWVGGTLRRRALCVQLCAIEWGKAVGS